MRKIASAVGCLVIAAYATVGQAAMNHDEGGPLIAKCHFGHEGYVIFRQRPDDLDHKRANEFDKEKIGGGKKKGKKLMQQAAPVNGASPDEEGLEEEVEADIEEEGALNEKKGKVSYSDSEEEKEADELSENEHVEENE